MFFTPIIQRQLVAVRAIASCWLLLLTGCGYFSSLPEETPLPTTTDSLSTVVDSVPSTAPPPEVIIPEKLKAYKPVYMGASDYVLFPVGDYKVQRSFNRIMGNYLLDPIQPYIAKDHGCWLSFEGKLDNFIFFDRNTAEFQLMSKQNLDVQAFYLLPKQFTKLENDWIIYWTKGEHGRQVLSISDGSGQHYHLLQGASDHLLEWNYFRAKQGLVMLLFKDKDGNHQYNNKDQLTTVEISLPNLGNGILMKNILSMN